MITCSLQVVNINRDSASRMMQTRGDTDMAPVLGGEALEMITSNPVSLNTPSQQKKYTHQPEEEKQKQLNDARLVVGEYDKLLSALNNTSAGDMLGLSDGRINPFINAPLISLAYTLASWSNEKAPHAPEDVAKGISMYMDSPLLNYALGIISGDKVSFNIKDSASETYERIAKSALLYLVSDAYFKLSTSRLKTSIKPVSQEDTEQVRSEVDRERKRIIARTKCLDNDGSYILFHTEPGNLQILEDAVKRAEVHKDEHETKSGMSEREAYEELILRYIGKQLTTLSILRRKEPYLTAMTTNEEEEIKYDAFIYALTHAKDFEGNSLLGEALTGVMKADLSTEENRNGVIGEYIGKSIEEAANQPKKRVLLRMFYGIIRSFPKMPLQDIKDEELSAVIKSARRAKSSILMWEPPKGEDIYFLSRSASALYFAYRVSSTQSYSNNREGTARLNHMLRNQSFIWQSDLRQRYPNKDAAAPGRIRPALSLTEMLAIGGGIYRGGIMKPLRGI